MWRAPAEASAPSYVPVSLQFHGEPRGGSVVLSVVPPGGPGERSVERPLVSLGVYLEQFSGVLPRACWLQDLPRACRQESLALFRLA